VNYIEKHPADEKHRQQDIGPINRATPILGEDIGRNNDIDNHRNQR
jgi:hypothetical protein